MRKNVVTLSRPAARGLWLHAQRLDEAAPFGSGADATRAAIEQARFRTLLSQDDSETAKAWITQMRASGPPPSPNLGVVMGPDFAQLSSNLGRNLLEGRVGIFTAVFEAA